MQWGSSPHTAPGQGCSIHQHAHMCHCLMTSGVGGADVADPAGAESIKCSVQVEHAAWRSNLENAHAANWQEWPLEAKAGRSQHSCMTRFLYVKDVEKVLLAAKPRFVSWIWTRARSFYICKVSRYNSKDGIRCRLCCCDGRDSTDKHGGNSHKHALFIQLQLYHKQHTTQGQWQRFIPQHCTDGVCCHVLAAEAAAGCSTSPP